MCGIAGFFGDGDKADIRAMTDALRHRGPDGEGIYQDESSPVFLGHRRLAIIDVEGGAQPMWDGAGDIGVVFNGEIYNHAELRQELIARGHRFHTDHSDTEVLVHGYKEWGEGLPERLNGMFAFAIYDRPRKSLFLARDRFGEKPLYYTAAPNIFAFASELSALAKHRAVETAWDPSAIRKLLAYGFIPAPNSALKGIQKLPGGTSLRYDLQSREVRLRRYWQFFVEPDSALESRDDDDLADELHALLAEATRRRMISDVPLGIFLSGGVDSSAVLGYAAMASPASGLRTFTIGFKEASYDESPWARRVADLFGARNDIETLDMEAARGLIPSVLSRLDEPLGDASILPTFMLCRHTRRHVTVALSGDGGDELFAGYDPFAALSMARIYRTLVPRPLHQLAREVAFRLPISSKNMSFDYRLRRTLGGLDYEPKFWNPVWLAPASSAEMRDLMEDIVHPEDVYSEALDLWQASPTKSLENRTLEFYTNFYLQDGILAKVDRAAMMNSLESRAVFLDNDVVDFCRRLPYRFKYRNGKRKYLLKRALSRMLPSEILDRSKKGFGIPLASWLRTVPETVPLKAIPGVRIDRMARAWADHRSGLADHRLLLWSWLSMQSVQYGPQGG